MRNNAFDSVGQLMKQMEDISVKHFPLICDLYKLETTKKNLVETIAAEQFKREEKST